ADSALLGWWGCLSYEFGVRAAGLPVADDDAPLASFAFVDRGLTFATGEVTLIVLEGAPGAAGWLDRMEARVAALPSTPPAPPPDAGARWRWRHDRAAYLELIAACQAAIRRGDAYQLCLTNTITVGVDSPPDPVDVYRRLRELTPTAHSGVLRVGDRWLLSASPEQFLHIDRGGTARTRPMKGTRPRSADAAADRALAADLLASEKERAENLMIVDLMRNDLSRVSRVGSVAVTELFGVEAFGFSHQLVSTVESVLDADPVEAVLALFPAGSMTGAPKHAAMRILGTLEAGPRGVYSGVWGRLSVDGSVDLAVVIRSIVMEGDRVRIGSGGGITAQSDPAAEWDEVVLKARSMLLAVGADPEG
ncbi:anthranilate synthase component I family protein, partial [uncultured Amnibacterium sp.]|uniref:anthranilate synthase component I family protein n=1 Tax=uncultured Amnibacterium sp. TaxID=1631851 RepID=UPI0035C9BEAA